MERSNNFSNNLKHHTVYSKRSMMNLKDSWDDHNDHNFLSGFSWPPRSYTCTFCKREFRSAQALGGHMNVHRRDRARLRLSPPRDHAQFYPGNNFLNLNLDPNPNPNFSPNPNPNFSSSSSQPSSPQRIFNNPSFPSKLPPLLSPSLPSLSSPSSIVSRTKTLEWGSMDHVGAPTYNVCSRGTNSGKMKSQKTLFNGVSHDRVAKKGETVGLNLEIGLVSESNGDELDLELRLGYL